MTGYSQCNSMFIQNWNCAIVSGLYNTGTWNCAKVTMLECSIYGETFSNMFRRLKAAAVGINMLAAFGVQYQVTCCILSSWLTTFLETHKHSHFQCEEERQFINEKKKRIFLRCHGSISPMKINKADTVQIQYIDRLFRRHILNKLRQTFYQLLDSFIISTKVLRWLFFTFRSWQWNCNLGHILIIKYSFHLKHFLYQFRNPLKRS